jgi:hypothetical protein
MDKLHQLEPINEKSKPRPRHNRNKTTLEKSTKPKHSEDEGKKSR